jgi:polysaccharide deacetylase family protein (PEP-CTERM system associated)
MPINNAFTIDVEDYYQVEAFSNVINRKDWISFESRVLNNTQRILDLLDEFNIKGTFFILGYVAQKHPEIVRMISDKSHEIASYGMSYKLIYRQTPKEILQETVDSKDLLEDLSRQSVLGYRAATYSFTKKSLWALDILAETGFIYDSSIFPMRHDRYGIPDAHPLPSKLTTLKNKELIELPISTIKNKILTFLIEGGGYFRLFPYWLTRMGLASINKKNKSFLFYLHHWELDFNQPKIPNINLQTKFRHYINISKSEYRLKKLFNDFKFTTVRDVLESKGQLINGEIAR